MRRSLAPSQKFHNVTAKKLKLSSKGGTEEKENNGQIVKNTLLDTLKAIRMNNSIVDVGESANLSNVGVSLDRELEFSVESRECSDGAHSSGAGDTVNASLRPKTKPTKFCPPTRFVPPLLSCTTSKANTEPGHSTETACYYSVIW